jgi:hypothetical protein
MEKISTAYLKTSTDKMQIKIQLYYHKGGMNYFASKNEERGYYLSVTPVERYEETIDGKVFIFENYKAYSGNKTLLLETKRISNKGIEDAKIIADKKQNELVEHVCTKNNLELYGN